MTNSAVVFKGKFNSADCFPLQALDSFLPCHRFPPVSLTSNLERVSAKFPGLRSCSSRAALSTTRVGRRCFDRRIRRTTRRVLSSDTRSTLARAARARASTPSSHPRFRSVSLLILAHSLLQHDDAQWAFCSHPSIAVSAPQDEDYEEFLEPAIPLNNVMVFSVEQE
jgi:hypothetical protein